MTQYVANSPRTLYAAATVAATITVTANLQLDPGYAVPSGGFSNLVVNDCATVAAATTGNAILTVPASRLPVGAVILTGATSAGFTVSQVPSGVAISVVAGTEI
jgi:hypothetical protein